MKNKLKYIGLLLLIAGFISCNNEQNKTENATETSHEQSEAGDLKPIYLTAEQFREKVWDYKENPEEWVFNGEIPVVIDFYADWCKPCKMVAPIMDELADHYKGQVQIYKVNTDEQRELATVFQITSIPAIMFAPASGKPAMQVGAMTKEQYIDIIDEFVLNKNKSDNNKTEL